MKGLILLLVLLVVAGCSSKPTYQLPDYYETRTVPEHLKVGQVRQLDELRCSFREDKCEPEAYREKYQKEWVSHRNYKRAYLFE